MRRFWGGVEGVLHPATAVLLLAWGLWEVYTGRALYPLPLSLAVIASAGLLGPVAVVTAWMALPSLAILAALFTFTDAVSTTLRIIAIALVATSAFTAPSPIHTAYMLARLGAPPIIGFSHLYVLRLLQLLRDALREAMYAAAGRGVRSRLRLVTLLPIPLLVHSVRLSMQLAEALYVKYPTPSRTWLRRPVLRLADAAVLGYVAVATVLTLLGAPGAV